jgi:ribosomal protein S18 acetylase RimI-like enzyme
VSSLVTIDQLGTTEDVEELAQTLALAFQNYPVMKRAFDDSPGDRLDWIRRMVTLSARNRQELGRPTPIARVGNQIVGGANVLFAGQEADQVQPRWFDEFLVQAGPTAQDFFPRFIAATESVKLPEPHTYLIMLGVHPEFQGQGVGKKLIEWVVEMSRSIPGCKGVALDTEEAGNVKIYESCGFTVHGESSVDDLPVWVLWRPIEV